MLQKLHVKIKIHKILERSQKSRKNEQTKMQTSFKIRTKPYQMQYFPNPNQTLPLQNKPRATTQKSIRRPPSEEKFRKNSFRGHTHRDSPLLLRLNRRSLDRKRHREREKASLSLATLGGGKRERTARQQQSPVKVGLGARATGSTTESARRRERERLSTTTTAVSLS